MLRLIVFLLIFNPCYGQKEGSEFFLNEYTLSINHSFYNLKYRTFGWGIGGYKYLALKNCEFINYGIGLEFNQSEQIQGYEFSGGHGSVNTNDFYLRFNSIKLPFLSRLKLGERKNIFVDLGVFGELIVYEKRRADLPDAAQVYKFSKGTNVYPFNFGFSLAAGYRFKIKSMNYLIKPEFNYGILNNRYVRISIGFNFN
jgi:hypothetical protein